MKAQFAAVLCSLFFYPGSVYMKQFCNKKGENVMELKGSGICGIAVISAIFAQNHIEDAARALRRKTEEMLAG